MPFFFVSHPRFLRLAAGLTWPWLDRSPHLPWNGRATQSESRQKKSAGSGSTRRLSTTVRSSGLPEVPCLRCPARLTLELFFFGFYAAELR